jgi:hypothetical protein
MTLDATEDTLSVDQQPTRSDGKKLKAAQPRKLQRGQKKKKPLVATHASETAPVETVTAERSRKKAPKKQSLPAFQNAVHSSQGTSSNDQDIHARTNQERINKIIDRVPVPSRQVIQKPMPKTDSSIRDRDIGQLKRRYGDALSVEGNAYHVPFTPSDPDFPYDVPNLQVTLSVPEGYPKEVVELSIKNGLEVGFARNIERQFEAERVGVASQRGLLGMLTWLDRNLERLLALRKSETIKIVRHRADSPEHNNQESSSESEDDSAAYCMPIKFWTFQEKHAAAVKRQEEISRLKTRLNPKVVTDDTFDLQLDGALVRLQVPELYPLEPAWILIVDGSEDIEAPANAELRKGSRDLLRQVNWISANLGSLAKLGEQDRELHEAQLASEREASQRAMASTMSADTWEPEHDGFQPVQGYEYSVPEAIDTGDIDDSSNALDAAHHDLQDLTMQDSTTQQAQGTAIDCKVSIQNIATLEASHISLTLKCHRCRNNAVQMPDIKASESHQIACPHCLSVLTVLMRPLMIHAGNLKRIGYLDLDGCTALKLSIVSFIGTCAECPVPDDAKDHVVQSFSGLASGQAQTKPCRACFAKLTVEVNDFHFLNLSPSHTKQGARLARQGDSNAAAIPKGVSKEALRLAGKHTGQPLPDYGICRHYRRSFRWFRFPCCRRVYACDVCHDLLAGTQTEAQSRASSSKEVAVAGLSSGKHRHELALFQICGFCSTEAAVNREARCHACGTSLVKPGSAPGTLGSGFWEGGSGTRDQRLMNRHDKRKYRKKL